MLKIRSVAGICGMTGDQFQFSLEYESSAAVTPVWSLSGSRLPEGLTLDPSDGKISGIFRSGCLKTVTVCLTAEETGETAYTNISFLIGGFVKPEELEIVTEYLESAARSREYSFQLLTKGGVLPVTLRADGLPKGLSCTDQGKISGIVYTGGGMCPVTVTAADAEKNSVQKFFFLTVLSR